MNNPGEAIFKCEIRQEILKGNSMISNYSCPLCKSNNWKSVQNYIFKTQHYSSFSLPYQDKCIHRLHRLRSFFYALLYAAPKPKNISVKILTTYERLRRKVLFEIWFPDKHEVIMTSQYCTHCGFMTYTPRPTETDLRAKYKFLNKHTTPEETEELLQLLEKDHYSKRNRQEMYTLVSREVNGKKLKVLDFGGGNGWYLSPFLEHGHECSLIDYDEEQLPGIKKIANELHEIPSYVMFDAIICRATLEHVSAPLSIIEKFHGILRDNGVVYALVPDEILGGISRLGSDPVTHINFFTRKSFELLFRMANFEIVNSSIDEMKNIWVVARKAKIKSTVTFANNILEIEQLLYPGRLYTLKKVLLDDIRLFYLRYFH